MEATQVVAVAVVEAKGWRSRWWTRWQMRWDRLADWMVEAMRVVDQMEVAMTVPRTCWHRLHSLAVGLTLTLTPCVAQGFTWTWLASQRAQRPDRRCRLGLGLG